MTAAQKFDDLVIKSKHLTVFFLFFFFSFQALQWTSTFTWFMLHPRIVLHSGTIRRILSSFPEISSIVSHPLIVPHCTFCKHLLLVFPYPKYVFISMSMKVSGERGQPWDDQCSGYYLLNWLCTSQAWHACYLSKTKFLDIKVSTCILWLFVSYV